MVADFATSSLASVTRAGLTARVGVLASNHHACVPRGEGTGWLGWILKSFIQTPGPWFQLCFWSKLTCPLTFCQPIFQVCLFFSTQSCGWQSQGIWLLKKHIYLKVFFDLPPTPFPCRISPLRYGAYKFLVPHQINFWCGAQKIGRGNSLIEYFLP